MVAPMLVLPLSQQWSSCWCRALEMSGQCLASERRAGHATSSMCSVIQVGRAPFLSTNRLLHQNEQFPPFLFSQRAIPCHACPWLAYCPSARLPLSSCILPNVLPPGGHIDSSLAISAQRTGTN